MKNKNIYFLGIGGIGMSAIAQYYLQKGANVFGYDLTPSPITEFLQKKGAKIHFQPDVSLIPNALDFVVYTPAIPKELPEYQYFINEDVKIYKRSEVLGLITDDYTTIAVAGTHGKTTTTSMVSHLCNSERTPLLAFIGGISKNLDDNFFFANPENPDNTVAVVEADEFDRSFLTLHPSVSIITSMDADHLDIYQNEDNLYDAFQQFANQSDTIFVEEKIAPEIKSDRKFVYGLSESCDCFAYNLYQDRNFTTFDLHTPFFELKNVKIQLHGVYNVLNSVAAISAFSLLTKIISGDSFDSEIPDLQHFIKEKMLSFSGVKRRFDYIVRSEDFVYIDDYAHHPNEMISFFKAVRELYPDKEICCVFQPHLYSRTRDFADDFAKSLEIPDRTILLPIYPAREKPIPGIDSDFLLEKINKYDKKVLRKDELFDYLRENRPQVLLTVGAGDIDRLVPVLAKLGV